VPSLSLTELRGILGMLPGESTAWAKKEQAARAKNKGLRFIASAPDIGVVADCRYATNRQPDAAPSHDFAAQTQSGA
jgi:hypothetical protein